jgi:hypothetical protein
MQTAIVAEDRAAHWIKLNHQCRIPKRWIAFDTESEAIIDEGTEIQKWRMGSAIRWRRDLRTNDRAECASFNDPDSLWRWITDYCRPGTRTVAIAHNLGYDIRIADVFNRLPALGWQLEWCNLDRNVSSMTWRSERGTLVLADLWTWLPMTLASIAPDVGTSKMRMPAVSAPKWKWQEYCQHDAHIVYRAMSELLDYIDREQLGNWQPTGAGMAYATWRHKFMTHKVLVHNDIDALTAERRAMHTGRAEAWRHGTMRGDTWTEIDMRNAYVTIAAECELPTKLKFTTGRITNAQYRQLSQHYRVLCDITITTDTEILPYHDGSRTLWPIGTFDTTVWDTELDVALSEGANVRIRQAYVYTRAPVLQKWAQWILGSLDAANESDSPVVRTWKKHSGRALIGRISLRSPRWELYGENPYGDTGITRMVDADTGETHRLMHVGDRTLIESARVEGRDSLPQITGWIMAECRRRLWEGMRAAGLDHIAHIDTDSVLADRTGLAALRLAYGDGWRRLWQVKASYRKLTVYGPRNYRCDALRKVSGVPRKAIEVSPNEFIGEQWHSLSLDMEDGKCDTVTISTATWVTRNTDPRRADAPGVSGETVAYRIQAAAGSAVSSSVKSGAGEYGTSVTDHLVS